MVMDLIMYVDREQGGQVDRVFTYFSYVGLAETFMLGVQYSQGVKFVLLAFVLALLLSPVFTALGMFLVTALEDRHKKEICYFKAKYQSSLIHEANRVFIALFQYLFMPIFTSIGIKLASASQSDQASVIIGTIILILVPLVYLVIQYHMLQIMDQDNRMQKQTLVLGRINFPNNVIDGTLIYIYFILIHNLPGMGPFFAAITIYLLRIITASYFRYY